MNVLVTLKVTADCGLESGFWLKDYGNDGEKSEGLEDLIMPATGGETCYTNSRH